MNVDKLQFIDLGLPSGKLWATENIKDEDGNEAYVSFDKAVETFGYKLPTEEDWKELFEHCSSKWDEEQKGFVLTGPNGNSIFLPAAGYRGIVVSNVGSYGYYWSSVSNKNHAYYVLFGSGFLYPQLLSLRYYGFSVRLVQ